MERVEVRGPPETCIRLNLALSLTLTVVWVQPGFDLLSGHGFALGCRARLSDRPTAPAVHIRAPLPFLSISVWT